MKLIIAFTVLLIAVQSKANQTYPGTPDRPVLSSSEVARFTKRAYLKDWIPRTVSTSAADYIVGCKGGYGTVQQAVNAAIKTKSTTRKYIKICAGTFRQVLYIPKTSVQLTIYGAGASQTVISFDVSPTLTGTAYKTLVGKFFAPGDPAYGRFQSCSTRPTIGTNCACVVWANADNLELINLTIENLSLKTGTNQAVALNTDADKLQVINCKLLGYQDSFYAGSTGLKFTRNYVFNTYIRGDTDMIFGSGTVVFEGCTIFVSDTRRKDLGVIFAPSTSSKNNYGFLVITSTIDGSGSWYSSSTVYLARNWANGGANGQLVIRDTKINKIIRPLAPYATATSGTKYKGNANKNRNLDDSAYNRFWEYNNNGAGA